MIKFSSVKAALSSFLDSGSRIINTQVLEVAEG